MIPLDCIKPRQGPAVDRVAPSIKELEQLGTSAGYAAPLNRRQAKRSVEALEALIQSDRKDFSQLVASTASPVARAFLFKALGAGHTVIEVKAFARDIEDFLDEELHETLVLREARSSSIGAKYGLVSQLANLDAVAVSQLLRGEASPIFALRLRASTPDISKYNPECGFHSNFQQASDEFELVRRFGGSNASRTESLGRPPAAPEVDILNSAAALTGDCYELLESKWKPTGDGFSNAARLAATRLQKARLAEFQEQVAAEVAMPVYAHLKDPIESTCTPKQQLGFATEVRTVNGKSEFAVYNPSDGEASWIPGFALTPTFSSTSASADWLERFETAYPAPARPADALGWGGDREIPTERKSLGGPIELSPPLLRELYVRNPGKPEAPQDIMSMVRGCAAAVEKVFKLWLARRPAGDDVQSYMAMLEAMEAKILATGYSGHIPGVGPGDLDSRSSVLRFQGGGLNPDSLRFRLNSSRNPDVPWEEIKAWKGNSELHISSLGKDQSGHPTNSIYTDQETGVTSWDHGYISGARHLIILKQLARLVPAIRNSTTPRRERVCTLAEYHYLASNAHLFPRVNNSLIMAQVNHLLCEAGLHGIPHGALDFFALVEDLDSYRERFLRAVIENNNDCAGLGS